jgi:hypothetical protein
VLRILNDGARSGCGSNRQTTISFEGEQYVGRVREYPYERCNWSAPPTAHTLGIGARTGLVIGAVEKDLIMVVGEVWAVNAVAVLQG